MEGCLINIYKVKQFCSYISLKSEDYERGNVLHMGKYDIYVGALGISHHQLPNTYE